MKYAPRAIICGLLERDGKILFLEKDGLIELPWIYGTLAGDPINAIGQAYRMKTDVKVNVGPLAYEGKAIINDEHLPVLVLKMEPKEEEYVVTIADSKKAVWLTIEEAKKKKLADQAKWLKDEYIEV